MHKFLTHDTEDVSCLFLYLADVCVEDAPLRLHCLLLYSYRTRQSSQSSSHQRGGLHHISVLHVPQRGPGSKHGHRLPKGTRSKSRCGGGWCKLHASTLIMHRGWEVQTYRLHKSHCSCAACCSYEVTKVSIRRTKEKGGGESYVFGRELNLKQFLVWKKTQ